MKFLFSLLCISLIGTSVYYFSSKFTNPKKKQKHVNRKAVGITSSVVVLLLGVLLFLMYKSATAPDMQCVRRMGSTPQATAGKNYIVQGNLEYDRGNCLQAISDYTKAIEQNPRYAEAYNNRAYTNMRLQNYKDALPDLDTAIAIRPDYINARMNRGDIYNYYYHIDRKKALEDYNKVIALGGTRETSVCGHRVMAESNNFLPVAFLRAMSNFNCR